MLLNWWAPESPVKMAYGIIADGSIRAGKSAGMGVGFTEWSMTNHNDRDFIMAGKTMGGFTRNILSWLLPYLRKNGFKVNEVRIPQYVITISKYGNKNRFHVFSGKDERSQDFVQGMTAAGAFFDEVALMPQSFVNQCMGRCSVEGAKLWFNCNPGGPSHWFKRDILDNANDLNLLHLHFTMVDNPSLSKERIEFYERLYPKNGVFYKRYIQGLWVQAEGAVFDMMRDDTYYTEWPRKSLNEPRHFIGIDYGTQNACVFIHMMDDGRGLWVEREYYYSGKKKGVQKTNSEYIDDFRKFTEGINIEAVVIDPSAAAFKLELKRAGYRVKDANNEVVDGIRVVSEYLNAGVLRINAKNCPNVKVEMEGYVWNDKKTEKGDEAPVKENDHTIDALRYLIYTLYRKRRIDSWRIK